MASKKKEKQDKELEKLIDDIERFHQNEHHSAPPGVFIGLAFAVLMVIVFVIEMIAR